MTIDDFRRNGYALVDFLAGYFENIEKYPVVSNVQPGDILNSLPQAAPEQGEDMELIMEDFKQIVMPGITHWQHPGWFAYFPANNSPESVLAEFLTAGIGAQCMIWQTSPAAAELEQRVMEWLLKATGLPAHWHGVIQDTASTATLCALIAAREQSTHFQSNQSGLTAKLRVYSSTQAHSSVDKAVKIAGFGIENLRKIPTNADFSMNTVALEQAIASDLEEGFIPCCVVASLGTTSSCAMDDLFAIGRICQKYKLWLHVDAAFAGTAFLLPEQRHWLKGVEMADSYVFNPHKWMLTNFDCSAFYVRSKEALIRSFEISPEYLKTQADSKVNNYRDWGIQLGRRFRALKLWFVVRSYGIEGLRKMVQGHLDMARDFAAWIDAHEHFKLMAPVYLSLVCFRAEPEQIPQEQHDKLNKALLQKLNDSGQVYLTHTVLNGQYTIRMAIGQRTTTHEHVARTLDLLQKGLDELLA